jgi:hypothetical protein
MQGLGVIARNYESNMVSANQRVSDAEYKAMKAERRAIQAEERAEYAERKHKNAYKVNNHSNSENELIVGVVTLVGAATLVGGVMLFEAIASLMSKDKS